MRQENGPLKRCQLIKIDREQFRIARLVEKRRRIVDHRLLDVRWELRPRTRTEGHRVDKLLRRTRVIASRNAVHYRTDSLANFSEHGRERCIGFEEAEQRRLVRRDSPHVARMLGGKPECNRAAQ